MTYYMEEYKKNLQSDLTKSRYEHTLGVADTAACLAMRYGYDVEDAYIAGLLHDNAKCLSDEELLKQAKLYGLAVNKVEEQSPYLLHGKIGAQYAAEKYNVKKETILRAIEYHTTGKPKMSMLEMIVFVADYIEPNRKKIPGLVNIRNKAFMNIEETVYLILENTLAFLKSKGIENQIEKKTVTAYEYYSSIIGEDSLLKPSDDSQTQ